MTRQIDSLTEVLDQFDVAVLDQWGVLHDGSQPYPKAADAMQVLAQHGKGILVVSNSGKRADLNRSRIAKIGLPVELIRKVITSGEALWEDITNQRLKLNGDAPKTLFPICAKLDDAIAWAANGDIKITTQLDTTVDAILLMGLAEETPGDEFDTVFLDAVERKIPLICSNPDKTSPRAGGLVTSPGALAARFEQMGGQVTWYGKPHAAIYEAVTRSFPDLRPDRFLMVGDSLEHDIAGAQNVGFPSAFIRNGIHAAEFSGMLEENDVQEITNRLSTETDVRPPEYSLPFLA